MLLLNIDETRIMFAVTPGKQDVRFCLCNNIEIIWPDHDYERLWQLDLSIRLSGTAAAVYSWLLLESVNRSSLEHEST